MPLRRGGLPPHHADPPQAVSSTIFDATLAGLAQLLGPRWQLRAVAETGSTNSDLLDACRHQPPVAQLLVAERQSAGRGRLGRSWSSQGAAASLTFSLAWPLPPGTPLDGLSLAVGVALAEALDPGDTGLRLKWPNDLWWQDRKLGGVLIEALGAAAPAVVVGVGLNLSAPELPATAGLHELDAVWTAPLALAAVLPSLTALLDAWQGFDADWQRRFAARDALAGRAVAGDGIAGVAEGVSRDGLLRLRGPDGGLHLLRAGEARLRPLEASP